MYDALYLPAHTPVGYDCAAGYVPSVGISHAWSADDWHRAKVSARYLLPIAGGSLYGGQLTPGLDAKAALARTPFGFPKGAAIALDVEQYIARNAHDTGYVVRWAATVARLGNYPLIYCSASTAHLFAGMNLWTASWDRRPHLDAGAVATQWTAPTVDPALEVDVSVVADHVPLWDTRQPAPKPPVPPAPTKGRRMVAFYTVPDHPDVAARGTVWMADGWRTRGMHNPDELHTWQFIAAANGAPNVKVGSLPYAEHAHLSID